MSAPLINTSTLVDIARHSNKIIRLSRFLSETESSFLVDKMSYLDDENDPYDLMMALDGDLNTTVQMMKSVGSMVESLDENNLCLELKNDENDFSALFPEHYDVKTRTLSIFGQKIAVNGNTSRAENQELKESLYNAAFLSGKDDDYRKKFSFSDYKKHISVLKSLEKSGVPSPDSSFDQALIYANSTSLIKKWKPFHDDAMASINNFHELRSALNKVDRDLIDEKVYSGRTTIYGVIKSSTYITKEGVQQVSSKHKADKDAILKIEQLVKEIPYLTGVEIDKDSSVIKMHDVLVDLKRMSFDIADAFDIKCRKTGNYSFTGVHAVFSEGGFSLSRVSGTSSKKAKVIAFDEHFPTVIGHELAHFRDSVYDEIRQSFVEHFTKKMNVRVMKEMFPTAKGLDYYFNDREIIARLGEIGHLLNHYNYDENESLEAFASRVSEQEKLSVSDPEKLGYNVSITNSLSFYMAENNPFNSEIYFNLAKWQPAELSMVKDYVHGFFYKNDPRIKERLLERIGNGEFEYQSKLYHLNKPKSKTSRTYTDVEKVKMCFGRMSPSDLGETYKAGTESGVFKDGEFIEQLATHGFQTGLKSGSKGKRSISFPEWAEQMRGFLDVGKYINPDKRPADAINFRTMAFNYAIKTKALSPSDLPGSIAGSEFAKKTMKSASFQQMKNYWPEEDVFDFDFSKKEFSSSGWTAKVSYKRMESYKTIENLILDMVELSKNKLLNINPSHQDLIDVNQNAQLTWMVESFIDTFKDKELLTENVFDLSDTLSENQITKFISSMSADDKAGLNNVASSAALAYLGSPNEILVSLRKSEPSMVSNLVDDGWLKKFGISDKDVSEHLSSLSLKMKEIPIVDGIGWETPKTKGDAVSDLNAFSLALSNHPAHNKNNRTLMGSYSSSTLGLGSFSYEPAISPIALLVDITKSVNASSWPETRGEVASLLDKAFMSKENDMDFSNIVTEHSREHYLPLAMLRKSDGGSSATSYNHPVIKSITERLFDFSDTESEFPSCKKQLVSIQRSLVVNELIRLGENKIPSMIIHAGVTTGAPFVSMALGENIRDFRDQELGDFINASIEQIGGSAKAIPSLKINDIPLYGRSRDDIERVDNAFLEWIDKAALVSKPLLDALMQGVSTFAMNGSDVRPSKDTDKDIQPDYVTALDITYASRTAALPFLLENSLFGDVRQFVDEQVNRARSLSNPLIPAISEPEVKQESELDIDPTPENVSVLSIEPIEGISQTMPPKKIIDGIDDVIKPVDWEKINHNVPAAEGEPLQKTNQFRLF